MSTADHDSRPIDEGHPGLDQRARCERCAEPLDTRAFTLMAYHRDMCLTAWSFCTDCYSLLRETIRVEVEYGPGTPPPEAWTKVRKLRAARRRRWGKADP